MAKIKITRSNVPELRKQEIDLKDIKGFIVKKPGEKYGSVLCYISDGSNNDNECELVEEDFSEHIKVGDIEKTVTKIITAKEFFGQELKSIEFK